MAPTPFDIQAYLARTGFGGPLRPDLATLAALHAAHTASIPFENLDIQLGRPIRLDTASLEAKLVAGRRGGYCFEQNSLFAAALRTLGFELRLREARVRRGASTLLPRTHLVLEVFLDGGSWLADVGFGGDGILGPVPMDGREWAQSGDVNRVAQEGSRQVLQAREGEGWTDLYALEPSDVFPVDLEMANHYTSTHPDSRFVLTLTAQRVVPGQRTYLRNLSFRVVRGKEIEERDLARGELLGVLAEHFGLHFPEGTRFRALDQPG
jgi:N-hydroxyarylamine O-acetyltransferase